MRHKKFAGVRSRPANLECKQDIFARSHGFSHWNGSAIVRVVLAYCGVRREPDMTISLRLGACVIQNIAEAHSRPFRIINRAVIPAYTVDFFESCHFFAPIAGALHAFRSYNSIRKTGATHLHCSDDLGGGEYELQLWDAQL
jgi:hypothetical protein